MKRMTAILALMLAILAVLATAAQAETQREFELRCHKKTSAATDVYDYKNPDSGKKVDHIAAGTYVIIESADDNWTKITYMVNGKKKHGCVHVRFSDTRSTSRTSDGTLINVHELDPNYEKKLQQGTLEFDVKKYDDEMDYMTYLYEGGPEPRRSDGSNAPTESTGSKKQTKKSAAAESENVSVEVVQLGSLYTIVSLNGKKSTVLTSSLTYGENVPENQKLAIIYAPRTGTVGLHRGASKESRTIKICDPGVMVMVLKKGDTYSKVNYKGTVGYIKNTSMKFFGAVEKDAVTAGTLSSKGKVTGKTSITVRNNADKTSSVVAKWQVGTEVTILSNTKDWYEIEAKGIRGYVKSEFLTMNN
ncbi:MAG: SH3 domain-containing protein [Clostridia bacterium]|nr:SH3 domain-containing protein [Clostridia bacterium]